MILDPPALSEMEIIMFSLITLSRAGITFLYSAGQQPFTHEVLHRLLSTTSSFNFQYSLVSLRSFSSCLRLFPRLLFTSVRPSIFSSMTRFRQQFLSRMWPIQLGLLHFTVGKIFLPSLPDNFSHDPSKWSPPYLSSTKFETFPGTFDPPSEMSNFQYQAK